MLTSVDELATLRDRPKRLLSVFAHPDDESYGCAGALARAGADDDTAAVHICLTSGEAYSVLRNEGLTPAEIVEVREGRMHRVAERTGIDAMLLPRLPDGRLAYEPLEHLGDVVGTVIDAFDPQVVIGSDPRGVNAHPDHIAAHWAVRRALEGRPPRRFAMIVYLQDLVDAVKPRLLFPTPEEEIDVVLALSPAEVDAKEDCLRYHEALVTLKEGGSADLLLRPAIERYDLFREACIPPLEDLFA